MSGSANVQSFDAVSAVRAALVSFGDQVDQALAMIDLEMRRMLDWLEHDRPRFWKTQMRLAADDVTAARAALHRCLMYPINDQRPSCHEEKAALKKAQARLAYCEEKVERLTHWTREVRHEMFEYEGRIGQLAEIVDLDVPQAIAILTKLLTRLDEYQAIRRDDTSTGEVASNSPPLPLGEGRGEGASSTTRKPLLPAKLLKHARELRKGQTDAESRLWSLIRNRRIGGFKFRRQHPLNRYVLDFYCHETRLAIELDGGQHNSPTGRYKDERRTQFLQEQGIRVLRFWNHDVLQDTEAVLEAIWKALHEDSDSLCAKAPSPKPSPKGRGLMDE